jgi:GNAT superfamily N-acetyltransferase
MDFTIITKQDGPHPKYTNEVIADFLVKHLEEYGDPKQDVLACLDYVFNRGGFITVGAEGEVIKGIVIINETGMSGYIPENILVYIAVDAAYRGEGNGRALMETALEKAKGNVALHVEPENPAKYLYENLGFTSKYLEMRYTK